MNDAVRDKYNFIGWGNVVVGILCLLGLLLHTADVITSRLPPYIYWKPLLVRVFLELTIDVLTVVGGWKLIRTGSERLLMIASSAWLGYALLGLLVAWDNADPSHLQAGNIRDILRLWPVSEWRNLIVVKTLTELSSNTIMLLWSSMTLRSTLFTGHIPAVVPKIKQGAIWPLVLVSFGIALLLRWLLYGIEIQAGLYST